MLLLDGYILSGGSNINSRKVSDEKVVTKISTLIWLQNPIFFWAKGVVTQRCFLFNTEAAILGYCKRLLGNGDKKEVGIIS